MLFRVTLVQKGNRFTSVHEAPNKYVAASVARNAHPAAVVVNAREMSTHHKNILSNFMDSFSKYPKGSIKLDHKISSVRQIAVMAGAGIPIHEILSDVAANSQSKDLREIYESIGRDINAGKSMSEGIEPYRDELGRVFVVMTRLGESTGDIAKSYDKLGDILEDLRDTAAKFKKALRTPLITLLAMAVAFTVLVVAVVPKFRSIFERFKTQLPIPTKILLGLEHILSHYGIWISLGLIVVIYALIHFYRNSEAFKYKIDKLMVHPKFFLVNKVIFLSTMYRYTLILGELVRSGIPVSEALDTAVGMVDNLYLREKLLSVNANIGRGMNLSDSFEQTGLFENMLLQMIRAGEAGGRLDTMLGKVTDYYDMRFQDIIDNLAGYIEPVLMLFIAVMVLLMALGIFLPMWDLGSVIKG